MTIVGPTTVSNAATNKALAVDGNGLVYSFSSTNTFVGPSRRVRIFVQIRNGALGSVLANTQLYEFVGAAAFPPNLSAAGFASGGAICFWSENNGSNYKWVTITGTGTILNQSSKSTTAIGPFTCCTDGSDNVYFATFQNPTKVVGFKMTSAKTAAPVTGGMIQLSTSTPSTLSVFIHTNWTGGDILVSYASSTNTIRLRKFDSSLTAITSEFDTTLSILDAPNSTLYPDYLIRLNNDNNKTLLVCRTISPNTALELRVYDETFSTVEHTAQLSSPGTGQKILKGGAFYGSGGVYFGLGRRLTGGSNTDTMAWGLTASNGTFTHQAGSPITWDTENSGNAEKPFVVCLNKKMYYAYSNATLTTHRISSFDIELIGYSASSRIVTVPSLAYTSSANLAHLRDYQASTKLLAQDIDRTYSSSAYLEVIPEIVVGTTTQATSQDGKTAVATDGNKNVFVVGTNLGTSRDLVLDIFDHELNVISSNIVLDSWTSVSSGQLAIAAYGFLQGGFIVFWAKDLSGLPERVDWAIVDDSGTITNSGNFTATGFVRTASDLGCATNREGRVTVVWHDNTNSHIRTRIFTDTFDISGPTISGELSIITTDAQGLCAVSSNWVGGRFCFLFRAFDVIHFVLYKTTPNFFGMIIDSSSLTDVEIDSSSQATIVMNDISEDVFIAAAVHSDTAVHPILARVLYNFYSDLEDFGFYSPLYFNDEVMDIGSAGATIQGAKFYDTGRAIFTVGHSSTNNSQAIYMSEVGNVGPIYALPEASDGTEPSQPPTAHAIGRNLYRLQHVSGQHEITFVTANSERDIWYVQESEYTASADLYNPREYYASVDIRTTENLSYSSSAGIQKTNNLAYSASADLQTTVDKTYTASSRIINIVDLSYESSANLRTTNDLPYTASVDILATGDLSYSANADLQQTVDLEYQASSDVASLIDYYASVDVQKLDIDIYYDISVDIQSQTDLEYNASSNILKTESLPYEASSNLLKTESLDYSASVDLQETTSLEYTASSDLQTIEEEEYSASSHLLKTNDIDYPVSVDVIALDQDLNYSASVDILQTIDLEYQASVIKLYTIDLPYDASVDITQTVDLAHESSANIAQLNVNLEYQASSSLVFTAEIEYLASSSLLKEEELPYSGSGNILQIVDLNYDVSVELQETESFSYEASVDILATEDQSYESSSNISATVDLAYEASIDIIQTVDLAHESSANIFATETINYSVSASLLLVTDLEYQTSSTILQTTDIENEASVDLLQTIDLNSSASTSLQISPEESYIASANLRMTCETSYQSSASIIATEDQSYTSSIDLSVTENLDYSGSSSIRQTIDLEYFSSSTILAIIEETYAASSNLLSESEKSYQASADLSILNSAFSYSSSVDILHTIDESYNSSASIINTANISYNSSADIKATTDIPYSSSANIRLSTDEQYNSSSYLIGQVSKQYSSSGDLQKTTDLAYIISTLIIQLDIPGSYSSSADLRKRNFVPYSADADLKKTSSLSHTASARFIKSEDREYDSSSFIVHLESRAYEASSMLFHPGQMLVGLEDEELNGTFTASSPTPCDPGTNDIVSYKEKTFTAWTLPGPLGNRLIGRVDSSAFTEIVAPKLISSYVGWQSVKIDRDLYTGGWIAVYKNGPLIKFSLYDEFLNPTSSDITLSMNGSLFGNFDTLCVSNTFDGTIVVLHDNEMLIIDRPSLGVTIRTPVYSGSINRMVTHEVTGKIDIINTGSSTIRVDRYDANGLYLSTKDLMIGVTNIEEIAIMNGKNSDIFALAFRKFNQITLQEFDADWEPLAVAISVGQTFGTNSGFYLKILDTDFAYKYYVKSSTSLSGIIFIIGTDIQTVMTNIACGTSFSAPGTLWDLGISDDELALTVYVQESVYAGLWRIDRDGRVFVDSSLDTDAATNLPTVYSGSLTGDKLAGTAGADESDYLGEPGRGSVDLGTDSFEEFLGPVNEDSVLIAGPISSEIASAFHANPLLLDGQLNELFSSIRIEELEFIPGGDGLAVNASAPKLRVKNSSGDFTLQRHVLMGSTVDYAIILRLPIHLGGNQMTPSFVYIAGINHLGTEAAAYCYDHALQYGLDQSLGMLIIAHIPLGVTNYTPGLHGVIWTAPLNLINADNFEGDLSGQILP